MNGLQKAVLGIGVAAIALMGIFPPWSFTYDQHRGGGNFAHSTKPAGYAPIYEPPKSPAYDRNESYFYTVSIDVPRLLIQWAIAAVITGGLILIFRSNTGDANNNGPTETNGNDPARPSCQTRQSKDPAQCTASSVPTPTAFDSQGIGPIIHVPPEKAIPGK
jgi:hypothetical protein